ncbi:MAG: PDZ domain-containing protein [Selenomonadales bacterium]|nr:PDZ domain-containing protein [Selenomonadales bacterium]
MIKKTLCALSLLCFSTMMPAQAAETIILEDVSANKIKNVIIETTAKSGMTALPATDNELIFEVDYTGTLDWGTNAKTRHIYRIIESETEPLVPGEPKGKQVELSLELQRIANEGTADEKASVLSWDKIKKYPKKYRSEVEADAAYTLDCLRQLKISYNGGYWIGFTPAAQIENQSVLVEEVSDKSPAHKAGLQAGDAILSVNGEKVKKMSYVYFDSLLNRTNIEGEVLTLKVQRGEEKIDLVIEPTYVSSRLGVSDRDLASADAQYEARGEAPIMMPTEEEIKAAQEAQAAADAASAAPTTETNA